MRGTQVSAIVENMNEPQGGSGVGPPERSRAKSPRWHGDAKPGLRERKKLATREALTAAAMRLALERGFDNLRVEDIAEAAGVSPRTFNNYFPSREAAICAARVGHMQRLAAAVRARPAEEALLDAIINTVSENPREPNRAEFLMIHCNPSLRAEFLRTAAETEAPLIEAIAERTGTEPGHLLPQVAAAAVFGALRAALQQWLRNEQSQPYHLLLSDALNQLRVLSAPPQASAPERAAPVETSSADPASGPQPNAVSPVSGASAEQATMSGRAA
ncbi:MAG TPA: TetR family transcriptional regulator [Actinocrinis sp.]|uniref:acyl-CoA-like ligand-binding transcription factor n=1 Tax=Actinocrinis sp. TaxID=1920516 RepID=UPI002D76198B|nr:TetR family transcriptional regulator [Actinocrinis sp.]HZU58856.1 TetR family transcriptional regulator [Actinocrinis sp.]